MKVQTEQHRWQCCLRNLMPKGNSSYSKWHRENLLAVKRYAITESKQRQGSRPANSSRKRRRKLQDPTSQHGQSLKPIMAIKFKS